MNILEIKKYPDKVLRRACLKVPGIFEREKNIFRNMLATMRYFKGIGLAAPQIGIAEQMLVADIGEGPLYLANPEILRQKGQSAIEEGCLSIPETFVKIDRHYQITVRGLDEDGQIREIQTEGLMATVLQHEIDHLRGKLIIDYCSSLEFQRFEKKRSD